jgi:hypothetical protein
MNLVATGFFGVTEGFEQKPSADIHACAYETYVEYDVAQKMLIKNR